MDYGMIGKIEKAKRYATEQRQRIHFHTIKATLSGDNNDHTVTFQDNRWHCDCDFFQSRGRCSHTMAIEMILEGTVLETDQIIMQATSTH